MKTTVTASHEIEIEKIRRHGKYIRIAPGLTATEGTDGNLLALTIRKRGKLIHYYRGSSLGFSHPLTIEDKKYLAVLATN